MACKPDPLGKVRHPLSLAAAAAVAGVDRLAREAGGAVRAVVRGRFAVPHVVWEVWSGKAGRDTSYGYSVERRPGANLVAVWDALAGTFGRPGAGLVGCGDVATAGRLALEAIRSCDYRKRMHGPDRTRQAERSATPHKSRSGLAGGKNRRSVVGG